MKLVVVLKLQPSSEQARALELTLRTANLAANAISTLAWQAQVFGQYAIHKLTYRRTREQFGLTAQVVVRVIAKVADAYKLDRRRERRFRPLGALAFDGRTLRYQGSTASIWTVSARQRIAFVCAERHHHLLAFQQGESDLVFRDGHWSLFATVHVAEPPVGDVTDYLGVDLGIKNLATDSDGVLYAGGHPNGLRRRHRRLRQRLQKKGTKAAKRLLRKRRHREHRFGRQVNHTISKQLVAVAQGTGRGIALENLQGIRGRVSARRSQRATLHSWSFYQLRSFLAYKAALAGVAVEYVDPRNTSRTCPACGYVDCANRRTQAHFRCLRCGLAGPADTIAATNIRERARGRAAVNRPDAGESAGVPA